jgi:hypothetical protein
MASEGVSRLCISMHRSTSLPTAGVDGVAHLFRVGLEVGDFSRLVQEGCQVPHRGEPLGLGIYDPLNKLLLGLAEDMVIHPGLVPHLAPQ